MKPSRRLVITGAGAAAAVLVALWMITSDRGSRPTASAEPPPAAALPAAGDPRPPDPGGADVAALKQELAALRAQVEQLHAQGGQPPARPDAPAPDEGATRRTPASLAESEAVRAAHVAIVESAFRSEPTDTRWSSTTTTQVREALEGVNIPRGNLRDVDCRSKTCRIQLADDGTGELSKALPLLVNHLGQTLPSVVAERVPASDGGTDTVLYMSTQAPN